MKQQELFPRRADILWEAILANAELVNKPTEDFYAIQHRMNTEVLKETVNVKRN